MKHIRLLSIAAVLLATGFQPVLPVSALGSARDLFLDQMDAPRNEGCGVCYSIELKRDGVTHFVDNRFVFKSGDGIKLHVKTNTDGFAYIVLAQGSSGKKAVLFPDARLGQSNRVEKGVEYIFPQKGVLRFDNTPGTERIDILVSKVPQDLTAKAETLERGLFRANSGSQPVLSASQGSVISMPPGQSTSQGSLNQSESQTFVVQPTTQGALCVSLSLRHDAGAPVAITPPPAVAMTTSATVTTPPPVVPPPKRPPIQAATASASSATRVNRPITDKWALIVGCGKYARGVNPLRYPAKDAIDFATYLVKEANFDANHVILLTDEKATRENIMTLIGDSWLPRVVRKDDLVLLYFSTHGTDIKYDARGKNYILTHDFDMQRPFATGIQMQTLGDLIKERIVSDRVMIVLDTCYSGNAKGFEDDQFLSEQLQGAGQIVVSACGANQQSLETQERQNGIFTYHLINALRSHKALKQAFEAARQAVEADATKRGRVQTPVISYDKWEGNDLVLPAKPTDPREGTVPK